MIVTVTIPGEPTPKGRPRINKKTGAVYTPEATMAAEKEVAQLAKIAAMGQDVPTARPVALFVDVFTRRDQSGGVNRASDLDNYVKLVSDALNGVIYTDDRQVIRIVAAIERGPDVEPHLTVMVEEA